MIKLRNYLALLEDAEQRMHDAFELLAARYAADAEIYPTAHQLALWSDEKRAALQSAIERYGRTRRSDTDQLYSILFEQPRIGGFGLVRDIHDASLLVHHVFMCWTAVDQAAQALSDKALVDLAKRELVRTERQARWLRTIFKTATPQALTIVPEKSSELVATLKNWKERVATPAAALVAMAGLGAFAAIVVRVIRAR